MSLFRPLWRIGGALVISVLGVSGSVRAQGCGPLEFLDRLETPGFRLADGRVLHLRDAIDLCLTKLSGAQDPKTGWEDLLYRSYVVKAAMRLNPHPPVPPGAERVAVRGRASLDRGKDPQALENAERDFQRAVRLAPWFASALYNLALVQKNLGRNELAIGNFEIYLLTSPPDAAVVRNLIVEVNVAVEDRLRNLVQACNGGDSVADVARDAKSCVALGRWYREYYTLLGTDSLTGPRPLHSIDPPEGLDYRSLFHQACKAGDSEGCSAYLHEFEDECNSGSRLSCRDLATLYLEGDSVTADAARALTLYRSACAEGDSSSCVSVAVMYDVGLQVPRDATLATQFYQRACKGPTATCWTKEAMGDRLLGNQIREALAQRMCDGGAKEGCESVELYKAWHLPAPARHALWRRMCDDGSKSACDLIDFYKVSK